MNPDDWRSLSRRLLDHVEMVVRDEDYAMGLGIQRALASGANEEFVFGRNEPCSPLFHCWMDQPLDAATQGMRE